MIELQLAFRHSISAVILKHFHGFDYYFIDIQQSHSYSIIKKQ